MPSTTNAPFNSVSTALSGGTVLSTLVYEPLDDWMGFQRKPWAVANSAIGATGPASTPTLKRGWGYSSDTPYQDTLSVSIDNSPSTTTLTVGNPNLYTIGAVIVINSERMQVTARGSTTINVTRAFSGSTIGSHNASDVITIGPTALVENADDPDAPVTQGDRDYAVHQMIVMAWTFSHRSKSIVTHEFQKGNLMTSTLQNKMNRELPERLEIALLTGLRSVGTGVESSTFGGLDQPSYITTRTSVSGPLEERHLTQALQTASSLVGDLGELEIMGPSILGHILSSYYQGSRRLDASQTRVTNYVREFDTPYGVLKYVRNPKMDVIPMCQQKAYIWKPSAIKRAPLTSDSNWQTGAHETQGWYERQYLRGDITFLFPDPDSRAELYGWSKTESDYAGLV